MNRRRFAEHGRSSRCIERPVPTGVPSRIRCLVWERIGGRLAERSASVFVSIVFPSGIQISRYVRSEHHWHLVRRHGPVRTNTAKRYRSIFSRKRNGGSRSKLERKLGAGLHHVRNKVHVNLRRGLNRSTVHASRHILHQDLMSGINRDEGGWTVLEVPNSSLDLLASKRTEADLTQFAEITDGAESPL